MHKDTPDEIVKVMQDAVAAAMADEQTIQDYERASFIPKVMVGEELDAYLKENWDFYSTFKEDVMSDSF